MRNNDEVGSIPYDKSNNVEYSLFRIQGRIARKDFFIRFLICVLLWIFVHLIYIYLETPNFEEWVSRGGGKIQSGAIQIEMRHRIVGIIDYYVLPLILTIFVAIQAAKRVHDCNRSAYYLLYPFYNIYLLLSKGSENDNDYGLLPHSEVKSPLYMRNDEQNDSEI